MAGAPADEALARHVVVDLVIPVLTCRPHAAG
jgi:hypothetical protein